MERKYLQHNLDMDIYPIDRAPEEIKRSAEMDEQYGKKAYGYLKADYKNTSFQTWFSDLNTIYSVVEICKELGNYSTEISILSYNKEGRQEGFNHTSYDDRVKDLKRDIDSGDLAGSDVTLTVFIDDRNPIVESFFKDLEGLEKMN